MIYQSSICRFFLVALCTLFFQFGVNAQNKVPLAVDNLKVEYLKSPLGIDVLQPRLSWQLQSIDRDIKQTGYQILVASSLKNLASNVGDVWDSKQNQSDRCLNVLYNGKPLKTYEIVYWKVRVWDNKGMQSAWSTPSLWGMGILSATDWKAKWIGLDTFSVNDKPYNYHSRLAARYLRKQVALSKQVKSAMAYISGMGLYEFYINGRKTSDAVLAPTTKEYNQEVPYNTFDVKPYLLSGKNTFGVILGNGRFFSMRIKSPDNARRSGGLITNYGFPKLLMQVKITYTDGSYDLVVTDGSWKITDQGPIVANNEFDGETYDLNKELKGWANNGYNDNKWQNAQLVSAPAPKVTAQMNENIKVMETLKPVSVNPTKNGTYILDMGQNMVGWLQVKVKGLAGDTIKLRFAETLKSPDSLYLANIRSAEVTDKLILSGAEPISWQPRFTSHGFRYVEVSGLGYKPLASDFTGKVIYDDIATTGTFTSSNQTLNKIFHNAYWTMRGNYRGMPTDCPQRDERMGWLGDRSTNSYGESFIFDNVKLYSKWMTDIKDAQKESGSVPDVAPSYWKLYNNDVTWPSTFILVPEMLRKQFGDSSTLSRNYPNMKKWVLFMRDNFMRDTLIFKDSYGDWCMPPESLTLIHSKDPSRITKGELLASAYFIYCLQLMQNYAIALHQDDDAKLFLSLANNMKAAFNHKYYHADLHCYDNNTATANLLALAFNIEPPDDKLLIAKNIEQKTLNDFGGHISTGLIGAQWLMRQLTQNGFKNLAYQIAGNTSYPSWGYMAEHGATTIWELWNGNTADPSMNSGNHVMLLGDLMVWYFEDLAGIKSDEVQTGFKTIIMKPCFPDGLNEVNASHESYYGSIKSHWKKTGEKLTWDISIPPNCNARLYLPASAKITESGLPISKNKAIKILSTEQGGVVISIGSGVYHFEG